MKSSYKIGLALAAGLLLIVIIVFAFPGNDQNRSNEQDTQTNDQTLASNQSADDKAQSTLGSEDGLSDSPPSSTNASAVSGTSPEPMFNSADSDSSDMEAEGRDSQTTGINETDDPGTPPTTTNGPQETLLARVRSQVRANETQNPNSQNSEATPSISAQESPPENPSADAKPNSMNEPSQSSPSIAPALSSSSTNGSTSAADRPNTSGTTPSSPKSSSNSDSPPNSPTPSRANGRQTRTQSTSSTDNQNKDYPRHYKVKKGQSMAIIAGQVYGNQKHWVEIAQANPTVDPQKLQVGQRLKMPSREEIESHPRAGGQTSNGGSANNADAGGGVSYIVKSGETLSSIAKQYYGDPTDWYIIFQANRERLDNDPDTLAEGDQLIIPPTPNQAGGK